MRHEKDCGGNRRVERNRKSNCRTAPQELLHISDALLPEDIADAVMEVISKKDYIRIPRLMILPKGHRI